MKTNPIPKPPTPRQLAEAIAAELFTIDGSRATELCIWKNINDGWVSFIKEAAVVALIERHLTASVVSGHSQTNPRISAKSVNQRTWRKPCK